MPVPLVALIRGLGYAIDIFSITLITLIPMIYYIAAHEIFSAANQFVLSGRLNLDHIEFYIKPYGSSMISLMLAISPLPIVYFRFFFKRLMKTATPGESIVGIASYATSPGIEGLLQESLFGLAQYFISAFAVVFACIGTFMVVCPARQLAIDLVPGINQIPLRGTLEIAICSIIFALLYISAVSIALIPHSRSDVASFFDDYFHLVVKRLR
ncbi:MAG: hypothetical protein WCT03_16575 [Candidatus Obscuribacterales bacterium]|jgi:hypothetical protein